MKVRRVVTGHSSDGKAVVASDTEVDQEDSFLNRHNQSNFVLCPRCSQA